MINSLKTFSKKYLAQNDGATAVEFALVAIPFFLTIFGIIEAGRIMWAMNTIQYTVEETSRYASLNSGLSEEEFQTYAEEKMDTMFLNSNGLNISRDNYTTDSINFVEITGNYNITTIITSFLPGDIATINFESVSRKPVIE